MTKFLNLVLSLCYFLSLITFLFYFRSARLGINISYLVFSEIDVFVSLSERSLFFHCITYSMRILAYFNFEFIAVDDIGRQDKQKRLHRSYDII